MGLLKLNRLPEASAAAHAAIRLDSRDAAGYLGLAFVTANLGAFEEALAIAERGVRISRASREKQVLRALTALAGNSDLDHAVEVVRGFAERVVEVRSEAAFLLSGLLRERGDRLEAEQLLRRAIDIGPDTAGKRVALADTLYELGREGEAIQQLRRALRLDPIPEVAAELRKVLAEAESRAPALVALPDHLAEVGRVTTLPSARRIQIAPGYHATCRYQRALESVTQRRRKNYAQVELQTFLKAQRVMMNVQTTMPRQVTGGRSTVELAHTISFDAGGKPDQVQVTEVIAPRLNDRQRKRAARALGDRIMEVLRLRYSGGTYRQDGTFSRNAALLRRTYQRQFQAYDKGAKITDFTDRSRLIGITSRGAGEYYVVDTRLRGASFVAGAEILLEARGYMLIDVPSGLMPSNANAW